MMKFLRINYLLVTMGSFVVKSTNLVFEYLFTTILFLIIIPYSIWCLVKNHQIMSSNKKKDKKSTFTLGEKELDKMIEEEIDTTTQKPTNPYTPRTFASVSAPTNKVNVTTYQDDYQKKQLERTEQLYIDEAIRRSEKEAKEKELETKRINDELIENEKKIAYLKEMQDNDLAHALSLSKIEEERQRARKEEEELNRNNLIREEFSKLICKLNFIKRFDICLESDFKMIEKLLNEYEKKTGTPLIEYREDRSYVSLNGMSSLILEVIHVMKTTDDFDIDVIFHYFRDHISIVKRACSDKQNIWVFSPQIHDLDETSLFKHNTINDKFVTLNIRGDGNCLWNSVSVALFGDYSMMESLRLLTASTFLTYNTEFKQYLRDQKTKYGYYHELSFEELVTASAEFQVWGDELHILALSLALRRPIYSYGSLMGFSRNYEISYSDFKKDYESDSVPNHFKYVADTETEEKIPVLLYYNGENHYSVILPTDTTVKPLVPTSQIMDPIFNPKESDSEKEKSGEHKNKPSTEMSKQSSNGQNSVYVPEPYSRGSPSSHQVTVTDTKHPCNKYTNLPKEDIQNLTDQMSKLKSDLTKKQFKRDDLKTELIIVEGAINELKINMQIVEMKLKHLNLHKNDQANNSSNTNSSLHSYSTSLVNGGESRGQFKYHTRSSGRLASSVSQNYIKKATTEESLKNTDKADDMEID